MKVIWKLVFVFNVLLSFLAICRCSSQESIDSPISYHKEFNFDKILVQFHENEKMVLNVSEIKYFFMLPNNFYCENVNVNDESLPLFFIESTRKDFFSLILSLLKVEQDYIKNLLESYYLRPSMYDILNLKEQLQSSFPHANSIADIEKEIVQIIPLPDKNNLIRKLESDPKSLSKVNSIQDPIENGNEDSDILSLKDNLENWKFKMRYIIPAIYLKNILFVSKQGKHASVNSNCNVYLKYNDQNFSDSVECIGSGSYGSCYEIAIQSNTKSSDGKFIFKKLKEECISSLAEITIFSHIPIDEQHQFCRPQSMAIGDDGKCAGYLMKYAEFGNLADFAANYKVKDCRYFYNQLFSVAKAINTLHQKGIYHKDVKLKNIFVCKKTDAEVENNYYFQLGDFGRSHVTFNNFDKDDEGNNIPKEQAETMMSVFISSRCSDVKNYSDFLPKVMSTMPLKRFYTFNEIKEYFENLDNSFTDTNSIKSNEPAVLTKEI